MNQLGYHIRLRLLEPRIIVSSPEERRIAARIVLEQGRAIGLLACDLPDDHLHALARCSRAQAGRFTHRVESSLKQRLALPFGFRQYEPKPIEDSRHLRNTVRYILRQPERHGAQADPFREVSNLPDLLGMRALGAYAAPSLRALLPRLGRDELLEWLGVPRLEPTDLPLEGVREAVLRASGLSSLHGRSPMAVAARRAAVQVVGPRATAEEASLLLGIPRRAVYWLRGAPADPDLVRAIQLQLGLAAELGTRADLGRPY